MPPAAGHLPKQLILVFRLLRPADPEQTIGADEWDVAQFAVANLLDEFLAIRRMAAHQPGCNFQVLLFGRLARAEHPLQPSGIGRE